MGAIDKMKNVHLVVLRIYPDVEHWDRVLHKLETFWTICNLPEILGRNAKYCYFVVGAIDKRKNVHFLVLRVYSDVEHWDRVLHKLEIFWGDGILDLAQCQLNYQTRMPSVSAE